MQQWLNLYCAALWSIITSIIIYITDPPYNTEGTVCVLA